MLIGTLDKLQITKIVSKLFYGEDKSEEECSELIETLEKNIADPALYDYIFSGKYDLTPEEIVEKALSYQPIITAPPLKSNDE